MHTLRRVPDRVPFASYLVAFVELGERFSYYGTTGESNLFIEISISVILTTNLLLSLVVFTVRV